MPECTKGPCQRDADEEVLVRDGGGSVLLYRCSEHSTIETPMIDVLERRPVQATLQESTEP